MKAREKEGRRSMREAQRVRGEKKRQEEALIAALGSVACCSELGLALRLRELLN